MLCELETVLVLRRMLGAELEEAEVISASYKAGEDQKRVPEYNSTCLEIKSSMSV